MSYPTKSNEQARLKTFVIVGSVVSTVSLSICVIWLPMLYSYTQKVYSFGRHEIEFCKIRSRELEREIFYVNTHKSERSKRQAAFPPVFSQNSYVAPPIVTTTQNPYIPPTLAPIPSASCCTCQQGPVGPPGSPGIDGGDGANGKAGDKGQPGETPVPAPKPAGPTCVNTCPAGLPGRTGMPGPFGKPGAPGDDGPGGAVGQPGGMGDVGPNGQPGQGGKDGSPGIAGDDGTLQIVDGPLGPPGTPGPAGTPGKDGAPGGPGKDALDGDNGGRGPRGGDGKLGETGKPGSPGKPGERGVSGGCDHCPAPKVEAGYRR